MLLIQQGCCAICDLDFGRVIAKRNNKAKGRQYMIDHSHDTGKIRGLLCMACNMYVGALEAQKNAPAFILEYIERGY